MAKIFSPHDDEQLRDMRLRWLRENRPKQLRRLRKEGLLEQHLQETADLVRKEAKRLVESGETFGEQAWQWALRKWIYEALPD